MVAVKKEFPDLESTPIQDLEREAYFYDVPNPELIAENYMNAIMCFEKDHDRTMKEEVIFSLEKAYKVVKKESALCFDLHTAAHHEYDLIKSQATKGPSEKVKDIMIQIYQTVFKSKNPIIEMITRLRKFLYQYKVDLISNDINNFSIGYVEHLRSIDKRSKTFLKKFLLY